MYLLDILGTFAFALSGAYQAKNAKLNIFSIIFLALITALGGNSIRDIIIDQAPLFFLRDPIYISICVFAGVIIFYSPLFFQANKSILRFIDSIGLASFSIIGTYITYQNIFPVTNPTLMSFFACIFLGIITACAGIIIRDIIIGSTPSMFKPGSNYILSAFWGSFIYFVFYFFNPYLGIILSIITTITLREIVSQNGFINKLNNKEPT